MHICRIASNQSAYPVFVHQLLRGSWKRHYRSSASIVHPGARAQPSAPPPEEDQLKRQGRPARKVPSRYPEAVLHMSVGFALGLPYGMVHLGEVSRGKMSKRRCMVACSGG